MVIGLLSSTFTSSSVRYGSFFVFVVFLLPYIVYSNPNLVLLEEGFHHDIDDNIITVGDDYGCVIERIESVEIGGEIVCWGTGKYQELNPPSGIFIQISAAGHTTCGISIEGNAVCWGDTILVTQANKLINDNDKPYLQVSVGTDSVCFLTHAGLARCTGRYNKIVLDDKINTFILR